jgi:hypothetical protein
MKFPQRFSENKDTARGLQRETIERYLKSKLGNLLYLGLTSTGLGDCVAWQELFCRFLAVERGVEGKEWEMQHDLVFEAFRANLFGKVALLRGDIDQMIKDGVDNFGNQVVFPFDVVSLDYSGGLFYRDSHGAFVRLEAISNLISKQAAKRADFVLLISCNLDQVDQGEVRNTLRNMRTELVRYGEAADQLIESYLRHDQDEARLKLCLPYFINYEAAKNRENCQSQPVIIYKGNLNARMMAFRFFLEFDGRTQSLRMPRERLNQIVNAPMFEIIDGKPKKTMLGLPLLSSVEALEVRVRVPRRTRRLVVSN